MHTHDFWELIAVCKGHGRHQLENRNCRLNPGDFFLIPPGKRHSYSERTGVEIINILFYYEKTGIPAESLKKTPGYSSFFEGRCGPGSQIPHFIHLDGEQFEKASEIILDMEQEIRYRQDAFQCALLSHLIRLLLLLLRMEGQKVLTGDEKPEMLKKILRYFSDHYSKPLSMPECARKNGVSVRTMDRIFRELMSTSPAAYLTDLRLSRAMELLQFSSRKIFDISASVGIPDSNYFTRLFSERFGISPAKFRKKNLR